MANRTMPTQDNAGRKRPQQPKMPTYREPQPRPKSLQRLVTGKDPRKGRGR
jgi:hypothetical protein